MVPKTVGGVGATRDATHVLSVGKGYRGLLPRFLDSPQTSAKDEALDKDYFALLWRADDWVN